MRSEKKIAIIDYHLGNLFSVQQACRHIGYDAVVTSDKKLLMEADYAILPGVGAFGDAMSVLKEFDLISPIRDFIDSGKPFMGVCLGLQLLFTESEEFGNYKGLNVIEGITRKFPALNSSKEKLKVPQIEWNQVHIPAIEKIHQTPLNGCKTGDFFYFVHSYYVLPTNKEYVLTNTTYGGMEYCSSVARKNLFACQFHPEKSGEYGLNIYRNFLNQ